MPPLTYGAWLIWTCVQPGLAHVSNVPSERACAAVVREATRQPTAQAPAGDGGREFFLSWGYNGDSYGKSDLHISQPALGNDFTLVGVRARDSKGWTDLFNQSLTGPQYNVRFGMFFDERWGVEVAFDHVKWIVRQDQQVRMTGTLGNAPVEADVTLTPDVLRYKLNNGANPIFINLIRRVRLAGEPGRTGSVAFLAKAGGGFAVPHTENAVFDQPNEKGFQFLQGWNLDAVAALRIHVFRPLYLEVEEKLVYARYFGVNVDRGTARHGVRANEFTFSFGLAFR